MIRFLTPSYTKVKRAREDAEGDDEKKKFLYTGVSFFSPLEAAVAFLKASLTSLFEPGTKRSTDNGLGKVFRRMTRIISKNL